ncbi:hypothetical protein ACE10X_02810 [Bradyrhizobium sp. Pha-3]|uniref:hypothetical protein n=1 Tax=Bradyrhizobium sp. Pha-3 TaxID=208375 RepID=UPI0035D4D884
MKLVPPHAYERQKTPFGATFCPYYDSRLYLLRSVGGAGLVLNRGHDLDQSKAQSATVKRELDDVVSQFEDWLRTSSSVRWPRTLVLGIVNRQTGMIDLDEERARVREVFDLLSRVKRAASEAVKEAKLLSEFIDKEIKNVTHKGTPLRVWDHAFIEGAAELYQLLTNSPPTRSEVFSSFVKAAYESVGLYTDPSRQVAMVLSKWRTRAAEAKSAIIIAGDGEVFKLAK